jgi:hypothetical protein
MDRKSFLKTATTTSVAAALGVGLGHPTACWAAASAGPTPTPGPTPPATAHTCEERIAFAERWVARFMGILDESLDEPTRASIMETNGQRCFLHWMNTSKTVIEPIPYRDWVAKIQAAGPRADIQFEGNGFLFQYMHNTKGVESPAGFCLCDLLESKPEGISPTYCHCSVGYVRELFSRRFGQPVRVTLLDSVLRGGSRCRFKVELA